MVIFGSFIGISITLFHSHVLSFIGQVRYFIVSLRSFIAIGQVHYFSFYSFLGQVHYIDVSLRSCLGQVHYFIVIFCCFIVSNQDIGS